MAVIVLVAIAGAIAGYIRRDDVRMLFKHMHCCMYVCAYHDNIIYLVYYNS